jgi:chitinase
LFNKKWCDILSPAKYHARTVVIVFSLILLSLPSACAPAPSVTTPSPFPEMTPTTVSEMTPTTSAPPEKPFRIIGYFTDAGIVEIVPFDRLTHINYAFVIPNEDGSLGPFANTWKLKKLVETAHQHDVRVLPSVGGWGWDAQFEAMAGDPVARKAFVQNIIAFVNEYNLDGVDIDWEFPDAGQSARNYAALMSALRAALPEGKLLTAAVPALGPNADNFLPETFADVDFLNLMVYDGDQGAGHSPYQYALDSLAYWSAKGLPKEKTILGVPFYARPGEGTYRKLVKADSSASQKDSMDYLGATVYYNGIPTIVEKTRLAMEKASGMMFWTLEDDTTDDTSLIKAIFDTAYGK